MFYPFSPGGSQRAVPAMRLLDGSNGLITGRFLSFWITCRPPSMHRFCPGGSRTRCGAGGVTCSRPGSGPAGSRVCNGRNPAPGARRRCEPRFRCAGCLPCWSSLPDRTILRVCLPVNPEHVFRSLPRTGAVHGPPEAFADPAAEL